MKMRFLFCLLLAAVLVSLAGCQPRIEVSADPADADFSRLHPEVVSGEGFTIQPDVRVFTLYAYLNGVAGWDEENGDSFSPERAELREALADRLAQVDPQKVKGWRSFYDRHKQISYRYLYYTMALGAPPNFRYIVPVDEVRYMDILQSLDGFNEVLADFYTTAGIEDLYEQHFREQMTRAVNLYDPERIAKQMNFIYDYLRLDPALARAFDVVIVPALYDSHFDANALVFQKRLYIVDGPGSNDDGLNMHEYLHMLMDDLIPADFAGEKGYFEGVLKANRDAPYVKNSYQSVHVFVEECMVRALDHRMRAALDPNRREREEAVLRDETANGLVLAQVFYDALAGYEQDPGMDIKTFMSETLKSTAQAE